MCAARTATVLAAVFGSFLLAAGAHPKAIQSRMGHSSITVTLDRYGHLFPELDEAIAEAFGRTLQEASERRSRVVVSGDIGSS